MQLVKTYAVACFFWKLRVESIQLGWSWDVEQPRAVLELQAVVQDLFQYGLQLSLTLLGVSQDFGAAFLSLEAYRNGVEEAFQS